MRTAVLAHSARRRRTGSSLAPAGAGRPGVRILPNDFTDLYLAVEIAWGADLTADPASWTWSDITTDVRVADGVSLKVGRDDEASSTQPATCALTVNNADGAYSLGGLSRNWPNVRRNTPLRVRLDPGTGPVVAFLGFVDGFTPTWSTTGADDTVQMSASGTLRRLAQGDSPVVSPMRRAILANPSVFAYWPMEDGVNAQNIAAAIGPYPMTFYTEEHPGGNAGAASVPPELASSSEFLCSDPLPKLDGSELYGHVGNYTHTGVIEVRALVDFPSSGTDSKVLIGLQTTGDPFASVSSELWEIRYKTGGALNIRGWARGSLVVDTNISFGVDGQRGQLVLRLTQDGGDIAWKIDWVRDLGGGVTSATSSNAAVASKVFGRLTRVQINTDGANDEVVIGHVAVSNVAGDPFVYSDELGAYNADSVTGDTGRLARLCADNGVGLTRYRIAVGAYGIDDMGPQSRSALVPLLREAEQVDHGILWDGKDAGLSYTSRVYREAIGASLTINASELLAGLTPVDDDQGMINRFTASRSNGGFWTVEDTDGPRGAATVGLYDGSATYNALTDESLPHFAGWEVAQGTVEGYRYPKLTFEAAAIKDRFGALLNLIPGARVDLTGVSALRPQVPAETVRLVVQGWLMLIGSHRLTVTLNASPFDVWAVTVLESAVGSASVAGEFAAHLDTDGATLADGAAAGATSLSVATTTGPLWTTTATDFPFVLDVGGVPVTATACSGASSPQTFTVAPTARALPPGVPVKVRAPARVAI